MTSGTDEITIAAPLVRILRSGLKRALSIELDYLRIQLDTDLTPRRWINALENFSEGCALLEAIGSADDPSQLDLELDLHRWPRLVLNILEDEHEDAKRRIQDAEADRFDPALIGRNVPALETLVQEIQQRTGIKPRREQRVGFLASQVARRRKRQPRKR